jgi:hypothetical protein
MSIRLLAVTCALVVVPAGAAEAGFRYSIGYGNADGSATKQVRSGGTITECPASPPAFEGDTTASWVIQAFVKRSGRGKSSDREAIAFLYGGPQNIPEPKTSSMRGKRPFQWRGTRPFTTYKRITSPVLPNGAWRTKVVLNGKVVKRGSITIACSPPPS